MNEQTKIACPICGRTLTENDKLVLTLEPTQGYCVTWHHYKGDECTIGDSNRNTSPMKNRIVRIASAELVGPMVYFPHGYGLLDAQQWVWAHQYFLGTHHWGARRHAIQALFKSAS